MPSSRSLPGRLIASTFSLFYISFAFQVLISNTKIPASRQSEVFFCSPPRRRHIAFYPLFHKIHRFFMYRGFLESILHLWRALLFSGFFSHLASRLYNTGCMHHGGHLSDMTGLKPLLHIWDKWICSRLLAELGWGLGLSQ